jgi:hypothetical protein
MRGQTKSKDFREILGLVRQKIVQKLYIQTDQNLPKNMFCRLPTSIRLSLPNIRLPNIRQAHSSW